ncbi:MAG TPA: Gfo/Idh/MocA family oxidoreductase [Candidatus Brocadiia bacterium]|nr:Gfo/Idh/MocA family oxidoreductase [Candidatus Brocadiia bacterium]
MAKKLRIGVVGLGIGRHHIKGYREHESADVVAICDIDQDRLNAAGKESGISKKYRDIEKMLAKEKLDVVSICTPNVSHAPLTIQALEAGCHVLCEKPMAMNTEEAELMCRKAGEKKRRLMIDFSFRFSPMSQALKAQVDSGILGEIYFARTVWHRRAGVPGRDWFHEKAMSGGGPLIDLGVHRIDLALWLMGYPEPKTVLGSSYDYLARPMARQQGKYYDCEDMATGFVQFANGQSMAIEASWMAMRPENEFMVTRLYGTKGGLVQRNLDATYNFEAMLFTSEGDFCFEKKLAVAQKPVPSAMAHFIDCIIKDIPHDADGSQGVKVMKILDGIYRSAETGKAVEFK